MVMNKFETVRFAEITEGSHFRCLQRGHMVKVADNAARRPSAVQDQFFYPASTRVMPLHLEAAH